MATFTMQISDEEGGRLSVKLTGEGLASAETASTNTAAQNAALFFASQCLETGLISNGDLPPEFGLT